MQIFTNILVISLIQASEGPCYSFLLASCHWRNRSDRQFNIWLVKLNKNDYHLPRINLHSQNIDLYGSLYTYLYFVVYLKNQNDIQSSVKCLVGYQQV